MPVTILKPTPVPNARVLGLDLSTKAGVARLWVGPGTVDLQLQTLHHATLKDNPFPQHQLARWAMYVHDLIQLVDDFVPTLAVIENYGFAGHGLAMQVELGTLIRWALFQRGVPMLLVAPNQLKKFVTGKGSGDKQVIMVEAYKRLGVDSHDDNQVDAACLAYLGAAYLGHPPAGIPASHLKVVADLLHPPAKPKKARKSKS